MSPTQQKMALDFGAAVLAGVVLSLAQYIVTPDATFAWQPIVAAAMVGAVAAARKWVAEKMP